MVVDDMTDIERESLEREMVDRLTSGIFKALSDLPTELQALMLGIN